MKIISTKNLLYRSEIIALYMEAFSAGESKQYIDNEELNRYIDGFYTDGNIILSIDKNQLIGALLYCPLKCDKLLPIEIQKKINIDKCVYVAEMMVKESARGQGIGTELLKSFFDTVNKSVFTDAFIRVWDQNTKALKLYRKMGFEPITTIKQTKRKADNEGTFVMQKKYLHRKTE